MPKEFQNYKRTIDAFLQEFLTKKSDTLSTINSWGNDVAQRLAAFVGQGKTIRGGLVLFTCEMLGKPISHDAVACAAAVELFQSGLLIHDDIMDKDAMRRGQRSMYMQYEEVARRRHVQDATRFGENMGICAGDASFFLAFSALNTLRENVSTLQKIYTLMTQEYLTVYIAQMQDIALGNMTHVPSEDDILRVYLYKTARYTFALPMLIGSILAGSSETIRHQLAQLGEHIGLLFQIQDDMLNLIGTAKTTGKPIGSDIREGKKTLAYLSLYNHASQQERKRLTGIFGNRDMTEHEMSYVHELLEKYHIIDKLKKTCEGYIEKSKAIIDALSIDKTYRQSLLDMVSFATSRTS
ncbi:hypothetical protein A2Z00_04695 [Candidatus Gottesmanbacteria bacterium RBG_13_45_10]|uniref:Polyprenyl synthetase n=1 Tax=Candidatus Gottesmanbacteria bacterium RBG_13_45_10 TaxID=1798370 RepID=A0A1F5ZFT8_9BACT|nr:MAG: hypothetical protein A2Z00_04695 [Candidatus Gottesmanbacteria bacterium RBG_13_45_10]